MDTQVGVVTHYFDKIGVAIVEVMNHVLHVGDRVKFSGHDREFEQDVTSLQVEHKDVSKVDIGQSCGVKTEQAVREGDIMYLLS